MLEVVESMRQVLRLAAAIEGNGAAHLSKKDKRAASRNKEGQIKNKAMRSMMR